MSIKQIREFTVLCDQGDSSIAQRLQIIIDQRAKVEEQITALQDALDVLKAALEAGTTAVHDNMPLEDMPQNIRKIKERIRRVTDDMEQQYIRASQNEEKS